MTLLQSCVAFSLLCTAVTTTAAEPSSQGPAQRVALTKSKLDCLLRERQRQRGEALAEQTRVRAHLKTVETFRSNLDSARNAASIARANEAINRDRSALAAIAARLMQAESAITQAERAIANLAVPRSTKTLAQQLRESAQPKLAAALKCGPSEGPSPLADASLAARLIAADLCGERSDAHFVGRDGISTDPVALARLQRILDRLDSTGVAVPVIVLSGCPVEGGGAFATSTTAFIGECWLDDSRSDDEAAFVVAHERSHVRLQHLSVTYVTRAWDRFVNGEAPKELGTRTSDPTFIRNWLAARLGDFDRDQEYEADLVGATDALAAGFSPQGIAKFLTRVEVNAVADEAARMAPMSAEARARDARDINRTAAVRMAADHPSAAERKKALEAAFGAELWTSGARGICP